MPVTVSVNKLTVVHAGSNGVTIAFPDVCKTPAPPAPPIPIPYPNVAKSSDTAKGAKTVKADGNPICVKDSNFMMSTGDEAGSLFGVASNKVKGKAEFVNFSFDVMVEGKNVPRALDLMLHNDKNTPAVPVMQPPLPSMPAAAEPECLRCGTVKPKKAKAESGADDDDAARKRKRKKKRKKAAAAAAAGAAAGGAAAAAAANKKPFKLLKVDWSRREAWCGDASAFTVRAEGSDGPATLPTSVQPNGGAAKTFDTDVRGTSFGGSWKVKDVLPPQPNARDLSIDLSVGGVKAGTPLKLRFAPNAPRMLHIDGYHRFAVSAENHELTITAEIRYVKGWGAQVVKLGGSVPAGTGGLLDALGFPWPGYRWMKKDGAIRKYWDGTDWKPLPAGFSLVDGNNICVGIYKKDAHFVSALGDVAYPGTFDDWNPEAGTQRQKIADWTQKINETWTGKFDLHNKACESSEKKCCRYKITMKGSFVAKPTLEPGTIILADGNIRSNTSLFFIGGRLLMPAHEVGHYIGNPDEYPGATFDASLNGDGAVNGIDNDSIMGTGLTKVKKRHFRVVASVFGDALAAEHGHRFELEPVAP